MVGPETRTTLINRLADPQAESGWREFVDLYRDIIFRVAIARGLQPADAEDVVQDVFATVAKRIDRFEVHRDGSFRGWLRKIARDAAVDRMRSASRQPRTGDTAIRRRLSMMAADDATSTQWRIEVRREKLHRACCRIQKQFSPTTWRSFWMTAIEQHSISETAKVLGRSEGSVRVARCRVMAKLKAEVAKDDREDAL